MARRNAKPNFIRRKGKKLFGAAKEKVLEAEKNRAKKRNRSRRKKNISLTAAGQVLDALRSKNRKNGILSPATQAREKREALKRARQSAKRWNRTIYVYRSQNGHWISDFEKPLGRPSIAVRPTAKNPAMLTLVNGRRRGAARRGRGRRRKNSDDLYQDFHGHPSTENVTVYGPEGMPDDVDMLGRLDEVFYSEDGDSTANGLTNDYLNFDGSCCLASNKVGTKYYIVSTRRDSLPRYEPNGEFGFATRVTYRARKDHLEGDSREHGYWHKLGEENGVLPRLCTDGEGLLVFRGGDYRTEADGIIN